MFDIQKRWGVSGVVALLLGVSAQAGKIKGDDLSNMIIEGENRLKISPRAPLLEWSVDPAREVPSQLDPGPLLSGLKPPVVERPPLVFPTKTVSPLAASPWLRNIHEGPVLTLRFKGDEKAPRERSWIFLVKDSKGATFYEMKKKSVMPPLLIWDGMGESGPLHVGQDYSYSFSSIDEAGNPQRFAGSAFRLQAFRFRPGSGRTRTLLEPEAVFDGQASARVSAAGALILTELKDSLRNAYSGKVRVVVYDDDQSFGLSRAQVVRNYLLQSLKMPDESIKAEGLPLKEGEGYKHVDIIAHD